MAKLAMSRRGDSVLDRAGAALGEQGRADMPVTVVAAVLGGIGRRLTTAYAPTGGYLSAIGKALELGFKPVGAALSLVAGARN